MKNTNIELLEEYLEKLRLEFGKQSKELHIKLDRRSRVIYKKIKSARKSQKRNVTVRCASEFKRDNRVFINNIIKQ